MLRQISEGEARLQQERETVRQRGDTGADYIERDRGVVTS